MELWISNY